MDFDDNEEEQEEEIGMPVGASGYESPPQLGNSSRGVPGQGKMTGGGGDAAVVGSGGSRKLGGVGGGRYRECLKNHAVGIGGHAVDGCGEFMAAGEEGTLDALKCAACNCHRNFHRKEMEGGGGVMGEGFHPQFSPYYRTPAGYLHHHHMAAAAAAHHRPMPPLALPSTSGGGGGGHSRDDQEEDISDPMLGGGGMAGGSPAGSKKRFRTKFTQDQKDKMLALAERLGWRIQKHDEAAVQQFCTETCIKRHVLKVWMHNNKHTLGKKP